MPQPQRTIQSAITLSGIGLHTGCSVTMTFKPAPVRTGIYFVRVDLPDAPRIRAEASSVCVETKVPRCTSVCDGDAIVHTVEHAMSALAGYGITNIEIELNGPELPGLDGSALEFLHAIEKAGVVDQEAITIPIVIDEPIGVWRDDTSIMIFPDDDFRISYTLDYAQTFLKSQFFSTLINQDTFAKEIAPCRTFCLESEAKALKALGAGQGANYQNTLVVGTEAIVENTLRFEDECARHKILDVVGDLNLLGRPLKGHIYAVKSGHTLNLQLLKKIMAEQQKKEQRSIYKSYECGDQKEYNIEDIMHILPHRYPFLLVDRVYEVEKGKRGVGLKNVTINDYFFKGHFPTRPVMPGVLMIEAMAQTAGVVILTNKAHHGKLAFFMAVNSVKFRKVVEPGDQLVMSVEVMKDRRRIAQAKGIARVNGEVVAEAEMTFSFTDSSYLH